MIDFFHSLNNPHLDVKYYEGSTDGVVAQTWATWQKPRGAKWIYMLAVGAGGSGSCSDNAAATSGGPAGGGSGAQSSLYIPAIFLPDTLYIQCGIGGIPIVASLHAGVAGSNTIIAVEPDTAFIGSTTVLLAQGGGGGGAPTSTTGGTGGAAGALSSLSNCFWAGKGHSTFLIGEPGGTGGADASGTGQNVTVPLTGLMVTGGAGAGGTNGTPLAGGAVNFSVAALGQEFFYGNLPAGAAGSGSGAAGDGSNGYKSAHSLMNLGGSAGGSGTSTAGGLAGDGGDGAPGCGGGAPGASTNVAGASALGVPGQGGDGFVYIITKI